MKIQIEFYRTRDIDDAHANVGHTIEDVTDLDEGIELARKLARTLDMPQQPDAVTITNAEGVSLYSGALEAIVSINEVRPFP